MKQKTAVTNGHFTNATLHTLIGNTLLERITDDKNPPLRIGSQRWNTHQLASKVGVVHTKAARLLTAAADAMSPPAKNVQDLYKRSTPYTFAGLQGCGETTMYVLWRLFESEGLDPDTWANSGDRDDSLVSFRSLKHREQAGERRTLDAAQKRHRNVSRKTLAAANN